ncbi:MAG: starch synthase [Cellvibrionaceae bacterium]|jgi:starch synthase
MKILFISAEVYPFAKRGGLADVVGSLPKELEKMGHEVRIVMPAYGMIEQGYADGSLDIRPMALELNVQVEGKFIETGVFIGELPGTKIEVYFIANEMLLGRDEIYGYDDDAYRFAFFSKASLQFMVESLVWQPDVLHAHDWHIAPAVTWLATAGQADPRYKDIKSLFTIHNLAHHGKASWHIFSYLQLHSHSLTEEAYDEVNFMARGIFHATKINTVSPTYADEIMTQAGGTGLDGLLRYRKSDVSGILNGLDTVVWNPAKDQNLVARYSAGKLHPRKKNKAKLQEMLGLEVNPDIPLMAMISRLDYQKGLDLMGEVVYRLLEGECGPVQIVLLGSGQPEYEEMFRQFAQSYPDNMAAVFAYRADLAPLIYAGSDMFLMPSLFEPCGLGQLISMRYGSIPVVRATGGLADTVTDEETGFVFDDYATDSFWRAVQRATYTFNLDKAKWTKMQKNGMRQDFSWVSSAMQYVALYEGMTDT